MLGNNNSNNNLQFHIILSSEASVLEFLSDFQHGRQAFFKEFSTISKKKELMPNQARSLQCSFGPQGRAVVKATCFSPIFSVPPINKLLHPRVLRELIKMKEEQK